MSGSGLPPARLKIIIEPDLRKLDAAERQLGRRRPGESGKGKKPPKGVPAGSKKIGPGTWRDAAGTIHGISHPFSAAKNAVNKKFSSKMGDIAKLALVVVATMEALEVVTPHIAKMELRATKYLPPGAAKEFAVLLAKANVEITEWVSAGISAMKAEASGWMQAGSSMAETGKAYAILTGDSSQVSGAALFGATRALHDVFRAKAYMERRKNLVGREAMLYTMEKMIFDRIMP